MDIVFLGSVTDEERNSKLPGASVAGNKMQLNIINHLSMMPNTTVSVISTPSIAAFPTYKKVVYMRKKYVLENGCPIEEVPFINLPLIKQLMQIYFVYRTACQYKRKSTVFVAFNLYPQVGNPLIKLKKHGSRTAAILADLPIDDNYSHKSHLIQIMNHMTEKNIASANHLIVLNKNAIEKYNPHADYIVMEGGCEDNNGTIEFNNPKEKNIVFCGRLIDYNGIIDLLEAMKYVKNQSICLDIYGSGPLEEKVKEYASEDTRIRFFGSVDNKTMMSIQKQAWLLINPRPVDDPISQVTFPSKMFEYLTSGTPVLTTKLSGFSEEYDSLMYYCVSDNAEGIGESINKISQIPEEELRGKAKQARSYVLKHKNWKQQAEKMASFLEDI